MKQPKTSRTNYRIGEFAEYMGVTPDFLKHYEECGLLDVHHSENGYRYFNFDQSSRILEYMRLRNYGVTVKEMRAMLMADADEALLLLDKKSKSCADKPTAFLLFSKNTSACMPGSKNDASDPSIGKFARLKHTISFHIRWIRTSSGMSVSIPFSKSGQAGCLSPNRPCISKRSSPATSAICLLGCHSSEIHRRALRHSDKRSRESVSGRQSFRLPLCCRRIRFQHGKALPGGSPGLPTNENAQPEAG